MIEGTKEWWRLRFSFYILILTGQHVSELSGHHSCLLSFTSYFKSCHWCPVLHQLLSASCRCSLTAPCFEPVPGTLISGPRAVLVRGKGFPWNHQASDMHNLETRQLGSIGPPLTTEGQKLMKNASPLSYPQGSQFWVMFHRVPQKLPQDQVADIHKKDPRIGFPSSWGHPFVSHSLFPGVTFSNKLPAGQPSLTECRRVNRT